MSTRPFEVPAIDITAWVTGGTAEHKRGVAEAVDAAASQVGFMQILGHGIPAGISCGMADAMSAFFDLDLEAKKSHQVDGANRGYSPPKSESLSLSLGVESATRMNDFFEAYNVGVEARSFAGLDLDESDYGINLWPTVPGFRPAVEKYFAEAGRVARTLTSVFESALGLTPGFFESITDHSIDVLRMNNYALPPGTVTLDGELTGMGEHTDFGIVTILWADQVAGLQVLGADSLWHDVSPIDGALLVNLGDLTARITGDYWLSTLHRVKPPVIDGTIKQRRSAAFFHDGNVDAIVATAERFLESTGAAYEPITVRDHIAAKLAGSRQGKSNSTAVREAARVFAAQSSS